MINRMLRWFKFDHLRDDDMRAVSEEVAKLAEYMNGALPEGAEKTAGMRKLLEAKDCFVRAVLEGRDSVGGAEYDARRGGASKTSAPEN